MVKVDVTDEALLYLYLTCGFIQYDDNSKTFRTSTGNNWIRVAIAICPCADYYPRHD